MNARMLSLVLFNRLIELANNLFVRLPVASLLIAFGISIGLGLKCTLLHPIGINQCTAVSLLLFSSTAGQL